MRFEGTLTAWHADRGYGAITPLQGGQEVFVHISAFPKDSAPPTMGELLNFEVVSGRDGRKESARVQRSTRRATAPELRVLAPAPVRHQQRRSEGGRRGLTLTLVVGVALGVGLLGYLQMSKPAEQTMAQYVSATLR